MIPFHSFFVAFQARVAGLLNFFNYELVTVVINSLKNLTGIH
jgi:hypothetical protein